METNGDAETKEHEALDEQGGGEQDETETEAAEVKTEPQEVEMKDYAEDTMNELLGIYGYDGMDKSLTENLQLQHFASEDQEGGTSAVSVKQEEGAPEVSKKSEEMSPGKPTDTCGQSVEEQIIICAWCESSGSKRYTLNTAMASRAFCSEKCFAAFRRSYFTGSKPCVQCQKVCLSSEMHKVDHKEVKLFFCSPKCVALHTSELTGKDRDTKIKKMLQRRYANDIQQSVSDNVNGKDGGVETPCASESLRARYSSEERNSQVSEKRSQRSFTMDDILKSDPSVKHCGADRVKPGSPRCFTSSTSQQPKESKPHRLRPEFGVFGNDDGVFLPPTTVMVPYPVFVPVPCPIPVPIPVSSKAFKMAQQQTSNLTDPPQLTPSMPQQAPAAAAATTKSIPSRQNLFPSAFYPVTRTSLPESVPGSSTGPSGYPPLAALPPEGVFHHGGGLYQTFLPVPDRTSLNQFVRLRGLQRSASMDLPVRHYPNPNSLNVLRSPQKTVLVHSQQARTNSTTHSEQETKELSRTVKEALRSHLTRRLSQSALNLTEVGRFPEPSDDLRRSHSLSRLPVRGMESVPEAEPSTSYSTANKRERTEEQWHSPSPSENGSVPYKRKREHRYPD